ncbi:MAG: hypothetical protein ACAF41_02830 [Leptolyngbya sp. BL-A-14]
MSQYGLRPTLASSLDEACENDRSQALVMAKTVSISNLMKEQPIKAARIGWRVLAALYATTFLVTLFLAYTGNLPPQFSQIPYYDKIGHVVLYGVAVYLGHRVFGYRRMIVFAIAVPLFPAPVTLTQSHPRCYRLSRQLFGHCCGVLVGRKRTVKDGGRKMKAEGRGQEAEGRRLSRSIADC